MKKNRTIKIQVTTREIRLARAGEPNAANGQIGVKICPVCCSHLTESFPVSVSGTTAAELIDDQTTITMLIKKDDQ